MTRSDIHPGPIDPSVLTLQHTSTRSHRSHYIWEKEHGYNDVVRGRRSDISFWQHMRDHPPHNRILQCLYRSAFWGVYAAGKITYDWALITALLERWRPETHTFHFRSGEATITLQDVEIMYGLPVDGTVVHSVVQQRRTHVQWKDEMERLTGFRPKNSELKVGKLKLTAICDHLDRIEDLTDDHPDEEVYKRCRLYILWMIGGIIFTNISDLRVNLEFLPLIEDIDKTVTFSWGSAALAYLYRCLCRSSMEKMTAIGGFLSLLQIWAWERLLPITPNPRVEPTSDHDDIPPLEPPLPAPYAKKWTRCVTANPSHFLSLYRDQFDAMKHNQFIWQPYNEAVIAGLPERCLLGRDVWCTSAPLICLNVVEHHDPRRVLRQFGLQQDIPPDVAWQTLHFLSYDRSYTDPVFMEEQIALWNGKIKFKGVAAHDIILESDPYMVWYRRITRTLIGNPAQEADRGYQSYAGRHEALARALHCIHRMSTQMKRDATDGTTRKWAESVINVAQEGLSAAAEGSRLSFDPDYTPPDEHADGSPVNLCRGGSVGRARGGGAGRARGRGRARGGSRARGGVRAHGGCQGGRATPVDHHIVDEDDDDDYSDMLDVPDPDNVLVSYVPLEQPRSGSCGRADCGPSTSAMGSPEFDDESGSGSHNFDRQIVLYNPAPLLQFSMFRGGSDDGYFSPARPDDDVHTCLARPEQTAPFYNAPVVTTSTSLPSTPILSPPQNPISWPEDGILTRDWVKNLMYAFDWASRNLSALEFPSVLPIEAFNHLVQTACKILHKEPNCVRINSELGLNSKSRVVVVGDVHGQLHDVLFLLRDAGLPSEDRFFVFNGDYVDRGAWGLETFLLLLAWKVLMPRRVFLLRGNHESKYCTSVYGFETEVLTKYKDKGKHVYKECLQCFKELPLASIISDSVYTAHGGIFRSTNGMPSKRAKGKKRQKIALDHNLSLGSLEELVNARRFVLDALPTSTNLIPGDVMWSDPSMEPGLKLNEGRGIGLLWGPDCTEDFLKKSNLKLIIRSHEGPDARYKRDDLEGMDKGYTIDHKVESGRLITLFSAPDYPQFQATEDRFRNQGAYIVLEPPDFCIPNYHSFQAVSRPEVNPYYDYETVIDSDEEQDFTHMAESDSEADI